jgi:hypothetical protein
MSLKHLHRLPRDIRSVDLYNVTSHTEEASSKIERAAKTLIKKMER